MNKGYQPQGAAVPPSPPSGGSAARTLAPVLSNPVDARFKVAMERLQDDAHAIMVGLRTPADYAIEHAGYLADAAAAYMAEVNKVCVHLAQTTVDFSGLTDCHRALQSAIYEFRKRAARATHVHGV